MEPTPPTAPTPDHSLQQQLEAAMGRLSDYRDRLAAAQREAAATTVSVRSKDRMLTVVAGAGGVVKEVRFHTEAYREMAPAELGRALVETLTKALEEAGEKSRAVFAPLRETGTGLRRSMTGGSDVEELLRPLRDLWPQADPAGQDREDDRRGR